METTSARELNDTYLRLHTRKEDRYWKTYMGIEPDTAGLESADTEMKAYISDPSNLKRVRDALARTATESDRGVLEGWLAFFAANSIEDPDARKLQGELVELEAELFRKRAQLRLEYTDSSGVRHSASTNVLGVNVSSSPDETIRRTSFAALEGLERWVLANGYLEIVKSRNAFARKLGYSDYFSYKLHKNENLSRDELDAIFTPFAAATRARCLEQVETVRRERGEESLEPWNFLYVQTGDSTAELDPYFPFARSIARWGVSFSRLGIRYRGAELALDLIERPGKYENGFMHGPGPAFFDEGKWTPARINFTSNATPNQVGNGRRGINTLFHEGGHAAHFANIQQNAPCFSQEYPPTSMAYAETQSMFCDSLIGDADWMKRYARDRGGNSIPDALIQKGIYSSQPLAAYRERSMLVVTRFESQLYALPDSELTADAALSLARACEREVFGLRTVARPLLVIPHLLSDSSSCSYQGYLLAHMAVYQTRAFFETRDCYLTDNPKIGPDLEAAYWSTGNRVSHVETIRRLTGEGLNGNALADSVNASSESVWKHAQTSMVRALERDPKNEGAETALAGVDLDAKIRIVHGSEVIATSEISFAQMATDFERWIDLHYPPKN